MCVSCVVVRTCVARTCHKQAAAVQTHVLADRTWMAVRTAVLMPCASGLPPPQGSWSSLLRAILMDLLGGSSTSALLP